MKDFILAVIITAIISACEPTLEETLSFNDDREELNVWIIENRLDVDDATAERLWRNEKQRRLDFKKYRVK